MGRLLYSHDSRGCPLGGGVESVNCSYPSIRLTQMGLSLNIGGLLLVFWVLKFGLF